ncbi:MAG: PIN domain-containing protein [Deltaproteobacteria bacterium]|nr:PIN domain-containing protein [Deltaproteobacteria bacterium]
MVTVGELLGGFARGSRNRDNRDELRAFLRSRRVSVVPVLDATAERYAVIWAALGVAGQPIPTNDMWIAAAAMEHGAELLTLDGDFEHVPQILVRRFTPYDAGRP